MGILIYALNNIAKKNRQLVLFLLHWFIYKTWIDFRIPRYSRADVGLAASLAALSITSYTATLLARRYSNLPVRLYYKAAAVWLGLASFLFLGACASWIVYGASELFALHYRRQSIVSALFVAAILIAAYGLFNCARVRVNQISLGLPNLPASWHGRVAALVTDMHLGHVRGNGFAKRVMKMLSHSNPDIVLIAGDMFDRTATDGDVAKLADTLANLSTPLGIYFVAGNHEEAKVYDRTDYLKAFRNAGVCVLNSEKVVVDGLQIVGINYSDSVNHQRFRAILRNAELEPEKASILLTHAPNQLPITAEQGIGLQLSGHTHGGQFFPFTWVASRMYGPFAYGLKRFENLLVYTSSGVGTYGPPMRVGTRAEVVLICFEPMESWGKRRVLK